MSLILGIETSCDETSAAVVKDGREILSNIISSQIDLHKKYGGVVPEIASRKHVELVIPVINSSLEEAGITLRDIDIVGVTNGPGLAGALLVGVSVAKSLAYALGIPLIGVNHIAGHIAANYLQHNEMEPPFICLVVSGGHSHIIFVKDYCDFEVLGKTRDDAAGEAFDKVARALGLGYPGGPLIDKLASKGNAEAIKFPRTIFEDGSLDFSFSGLKTAIVNYINKADKDNTLCIEDVAASFQKAVVDVLVLNLLKAAEMRGVKKVLLAGGVAANSLLREELSHEAEKRGINVLFPSIELCTDNAAMIASSAFYEFKKGNVAELDLNAIPNLKLND